MLESANDGFKVHGENEWNVLIFDIMTASVKVKVSQFLKFMTRGLKSFYNKIFHC